MDIKNIDLILGFIKGSLMMGVLFEKYDDGVIYVSVPSNFSGATNYDEIESNVNRLKDIWKQVIDLSDTFRLAFRVRDEKWSNEKGDEIMKSASGYSIKRYLLPIVPSGGIPEHDLDMRIFMMKDRLNRDYSENDQMIAYFKLNGNNSNKECLKNKFIR